MPGHDDIAWFNVVVKNAMVAAHSLEVPAVGLDPLDDVAHLQP
jgi:hypothetical protein